ncbi:Hypothetical protein NCS54_01213900 [Fusarium falciforme]|uniref:Hypothetical protein n=1 Tax=Fusarium falciforme TaxID=195108 RepID=UPI002300E9AA|nr:Hypothetical protein NCS54_01213900 [Fusarium falciforme]WAO94550.1 Hypothetical protein NCS54_01213900 [Fusarium falciforme]
MKLITFGLAALLIAVTSATIQPSRRASNPPAARVLLGSVEHIYVADFFPNINMWFITLMKKVPGTPSWMTFMPPNRLYAADASSTTLRVFELDLQNNTLELRRESQASSGVVHLQFNADKTRLIGSAYGAGTIDVWDIEGGNLDLLKTIRSPGKLGLNAERQSAPHPHQTAFDPTGSFLVVNDLGTDSIIIIDGRDDRYEILDNIYAKPSGCGPRHGVFYPQGAAKATHYIIICELSNQVLVYSVTYHTDRLSLQQVQDLPAFGPKFPPKDDLTTTSSAIILSPDNKDLYISNRLTGMRIDTVTQFRLCQSNCSFPQLTYARTTSTGGIVPRMISFSQDGEYIFAGNQNEGFGLVALRRDKDGTLQNRRVAQIRGSIFGEKGSGPQFVKQIA